MSTSRGRRLGSWSTSSLERGRAGAKLLVSLANEYVSLANECGCKCIRKIGGFSLFPGLHDDLELATASGELELKFGVHSDTASDLRSQQRALPRRDLRGHAPLGSQLVVDRGCYLRRRLQQIHSKERAGLLGAEVVPRRVKVPAKQERVLQALKTTPIADGPAKCLAARVREERLGLRFAATEPAGSLSWRLHVYLPETPAQFGGTEEPPPHRPALPLPQAASLQGHALCT